MKNNVKQFVAEWEVCQRAKYEATSPAGLLQPLLVPSNIWEDLSIDFIFGLSKVKGFDTVLVLVDRLTKYAQFIVIQHLYITKDIASVFIREIVRLHGFLRTIVSNHDRIFMSHFLLELFRAVETKMKFSLAYHPQTDEQTKVVNCNIET